MNVIQQAIKTKTMLTETLSGKCPNCNYNKLLQRYGSTGYFQLDACPKCGFAYGTNHYDIESFGVEAWLGYFTYILEIVTNKSNKELSKIKPTEIRRMIFEWAEKEERADDISSTIFVYSEKDVKNYAKKGNKIF